MDPDSLPAQGAGPVSTHQSTDAAANVIEPQSTYRRFIASVFDHLQQMLYDAVQPVTRSSDMHSDIRGGLNGGDDGGEGSPSSPTFPGAYPHPPMTAFTAEIQGNNIHRPRTVAVSPSKLRCSDTNQNFFQNASSFTISNSRFVNIVNNSIGTAGLGALKEFISFSALHDSSAQDPERRCHPGTRETILRQICDWIDDPNTTDRILWLHGPAGVGKSAIAQTVAHSFGRDMVAATFFFFRSDSTRNDGNRLFPTLAWQLAKSIPGAGDYIAHTLEEDPDIPLKAIEIQFERLIAQPLMRMTEALSEARTLSHVVIIDGVDECADSKLQSRFLKVIGGLVTHSRVPLRFFVSSRPEADIQDAFSQFKAATLSIDLAQVEDSLRDIERYLTAEISRIATEHRLDPLTWPGESVIQEFVLKSSGQFVYASTVIRFVGDKYNSAASQLNIILGLKPSKGKSPFAELDTLYIEILHRQPDQEFLKEFLTLLVSRSELPAPRGHDLGRDDSLLLNVDDNELQRKLRGMYSLLKFDPYIGVHHRSFLDFLQHPSRSGPYHVDAHSGRRRYLELITQVVVQYASKIIEHPDYHGPEHFAPAFYHLTPRHLRFIKLPLLDWEEILLPLWGVKGELLKMPSRHELCGTCYIFDVIDNMLLYHQLLRGTLDPIPSSLPGQVEATHWGFSLPENVAQTVTVGNTDGWQQQGSTNISNETRKGGPQTTSGNEVADLFSALIRNLPNTESETSTSVMAIERLRACLSLDPIEAALTIRSVSDAQNLVDLLFYLVKNKQLLDRYPSDLARKVIQLALELWRTTKLLPRSIFLKQADVAFSRCSHDSVDVWRTAVIGRDVTRLCESLYTWAFLFHTAVLPLLGVYHSSNESTGACFAYLGVKHYLTLTGWRHESNPPVAAIQRLMLALAHAVQFMHSFGVLCYIDKESVFLGSNSHPKISGNRFHLPHYNDIPSAKQDNIFNVGWVFYEVLYDVEVSLDWTEPANGNKLVDPEAFKKRPLEPEIPDHTWELIQRCCVTEPGDRPTIDEIVEEMESWK